MRRVSLALIAVVGLGIPRGVAGEPKPAGDVAPLETFTADQRDHWAYQPLVAARACPR